MIAVARSFSFGRWGWLPVHVALLLGLSVAAFDRNLAQLFVANDGPTVIALSVEQMQFFGISLDLHSNVLQGLGDLSFPLNHSLLPGYWLPYLDETGRFWPVPVMAWFAVLTFLSVALVGWGRGFPPAICLSGAWVITILGFPYYSSLRIFATTGIAPDFMLLLAWVAMCDIAICRIGARGMRAAVGYFALLLAAVVTMLWVWPPALTLFVGYLAFAGIFALATGPLRQKLRTLLWGVAILAVAVAAGWAEYAAGIILDCFGSVYWQELLPMYSSDPIFAGMLFEGAISHFQAGPWLVAAAALGALGCLWERKSRLRNLAIAMLAVLVIQPVGGALVLRWPGGWSGPPPVYLEVAFWPFHGLFAAMLPLHLNRMLRRWWPSVWFAARPWLEHAAWVAAGFGLILLHLLEEPDLDRSGSYAIPPADTAITEVLTREIAVPPGSRFNGRVANVVPGEGLSLQIPYFSKLNTAVRNDHQSVGMWMKDIPTLHMYTHTITPWFYRLYRDLLTVPSDAQVRNWTNYSRYDARTFRLLGVRYVVSPVDSLPEARRRAEVAAPDVAPLHLFELEGANTSGIAARQILRVPTIEAAVAALGSPEFNLQTAVVFADLPVGGLRPVRDSEIRIERGGFHVRAHSDGNSLLVLPIEFGGCLAMTPLSGERPDVLRVDLALTGVLFNGAVDILLDQRTGPFTHPRCRMADYREFKRLQAR